MLAGKHRPESHWRPRSLVVTASEATTPENPQEPGLTVFSSGPYCTFACVHECVLSRFSCVWVFATLWTVTHQAPLSIGFFRQEYWSGLPCLLQGIFPTQGSNLHLLQLLHCRQILYHWATGEAHADTGQVMMRLNWIIESQSNILYLYKMRGIRT